MGINVKQENPFAVSSIGDESHAPINRSCIVASVCLMAFGVVETVGFYLIVSMGFVYPLLSVVILAAVLIVQYFEFWRGCRRFMGWPFLVFVVAVFQVGPLLCFFSTTLEHLYDLPFTVMRKIISAEGKWGRTL